MTSASCNLETPNQRLRSVLVVDDDPILREVMAEQFATLGWTVQCAENGEAAIGLLLKSNFDLAIIDISMPRLDGFGLLRQLRQNPRTLDLPAIVCTSHNDPEAIEQAYRQGASSFVTKPVNWPQFRHHVQFVMRNGETERALRAARAEAMLASRTKSAMFQVLSHELKTPLTALIGLTGVMEKSLAGLGGHDVEQQLSHVVEAAQKLNGIVSDVMLLSKAVAGQRKQEYLESPLNELLEDGLAGLKAKAAARKVQLLVRPQQEQASVLCDPRLIRQAISKIADNAIRFSPEGGIVELWGHVRANGSIFLSVKDNGPGLTQQKLKECLQPFVQENMGYSRPAEGLGLGLPIAKAICEAHGGELAIQTAPGLGLLAAIVLPSSLLVRRLEAGNG